MNLILEVLTILTLVESKKHWYTGFFDGSKKCHNAVRREDLKKVREHCLGTNDICSRNRIGNNAIQLAAKMCNAEIFYELMNNNATDSCFHEKTRYSRRTPFKIVATSTNSWFLRGCSDNYDISLIEKATTKDAIVKEINLLNDIFLDDKRMERVLSKSSSDLEYIFENSPKLEKQLNMFKHIAVEDNKYKIMKLLLDKHDWHKNLLTALDSDPLTSEDMEKKQEFFLSQLESDEEKQIDRVDRIPKGELRARLVSTFTQKFLTDFGLTEKDINDENCYDKALKAMNLLSIKKLIFVGCSPKFLLKQAHSNPKLIDLVVKSVSDIDELDDNQKTLLCYACIDGHFDVAKALIDANANVNAQNNESSPLQFASARGSLDIVELLISSNADVNYQDKNGFTVLHWASTQGKTSILDSLLKAGADLNKKDKTEKSIIHTASDKGFPEMVLAILEKGVDPNSVDKEKNTPLHFAALSGHDKVVRILLEQTSNKNPHNNEQRTPIHFASRGDQPAVIETLLKMSEVEVDTVDSKGNTPLHVAATEGSLEAAKILLSHGADINKKTYSNWGFGQRTPLYLAQYYSHDHLLGPSRNENQRCRCASVAVLLKDSGADLSYEYESWGKWTTKCVKNTAKFAVKLPVGMIAVGLGMG